MIKKLLTSKIATITLLCCLSFVAGGVNGFLGTGGGIVFLFMLTRFTQIDKKDAFATTLCATVPISLLALFNYVKAGNVDFALMKEIWLPTAIGGVLGAVLVDRLRVRWLTVILASLMIYSGTCMIFR